MYEKFILCGESKLCLACALKNANDGTLAVCSKLLNTWSCREVFVMNISYFLVSVVKGHKA